MTGNIHLSERVPDAIGADDLNNYGVEIIKRTQNLQSNNNFHFLFLWGIANIKHAKVQRSKFDRKGWSIYYVITDRGGGVFPNDYRLHRGGSGQMITVLHRGGLTKWLQYYNGGGGAHLRQFEANYIFQGWIFFRGEFFSEVTIRDHPYIT